MPHSRYWSSSDEVYVAGLARGKIYREFRRADPNLRHCVGHANMLDSINAVALKAAAQKRARKAPSASQPRPGPSPTIRKISDEYLNTHPQSVHVEDVPTKAEDECNLSLKNHFPSPTVYEEDSDSSSDDSSPPSSPPMVTVSISSVEVDDNDDYDEYGLPPHPLKRVRSEPESAHGHAPPIFIGDAGDNASPATGMLATLNVSEELSNEEWWDD